MYTWFKMKTHRCLSIYLSLVSLVTGYKILTIPYSSGFNSRLLNMQKIADILAQDGHEVSVLMNNRVRNHVITKYANVLEFHVPKFVQGVDDKNMRDPSLLNGYQLQEMALGIEMGFCEAMLKDKQLWKTIEEEDFDLIFTDVESKCGFVVMSALNKTAIVYLNVLVQTYPPLLYPVFPSFTCTYPGMVCIDENMSFPEKVWHFYLYFSLSMWLSPKALSLMEKAVTENDIKLKAPLANAMKNQIVVINSHYALDTPIPNMPNVFSISGLFHQEPSPMSQEFQRVVTLSEPHGVILLSFGTLLQDFDASVADMFARVFGRLPHQIIWRFTGKPPKSLKSNTHLVKWFPQSDLLASPSLKMFITHCGISSTFESALHAVPVLAIPMFGDQEGNAAKLTKKLKMGISLVFHSITEEQFERGIKEVLSNPMYKENAKKAAFLLNDHLVSPQQQLRHLVNFTIKSGGAPHLFHPYAAEMNWFQFYGLDVLLFLLALLVAVFGVSLYLIKVITIFVCNCFTGQKVKSQ